MAPCRDSELTVATGVSLAGCFWVATKAFLVVTKPSGSLYGSYENF